MTKQLSLFGHAEPTAFKYKVKYPQSDHKVPPELDEEWQLRAVVECLAGPLDDDWMSTHKDLIARLTASDPQFQYNPRTKAGKALRDALMSGEEDV